MVLRTLRGVRLNRQTVVPVAVVFAIVGTLLLLRSFAATGVISYEAEDGTVTGNARKVDDSSASGGRYASVNLPTVTPPPPPPTTGRKQFFLHQQLPPDI